jgi:hypothetical protein
MVTTLPSLLPTVLKNLHFHFREHEQFSIEKLLFAVDVRERRYFLTLTLTNRKVDAWIVLELHFARIDSNFFFTWENVLRLIPEFLFISCSPGFDAEGLLEILSSSLTGNIYCQNNG